jgi:hypothetical protein
MNTLSTARRTAEAAFTADPTDANLKALQAAGKAEMDMVVGEFDTRNADEAPVEQNAAQTVVWPEARNFAEWFVALMDRNLNCTNVSEFEHRAYLGHISYSLSMTDGYYAPESLGAWVLGFRQDPAGALYIGNDNRYELAPMVRSYTAQISA